MSHRALALIVVLAVGIGCESGPPQPGDDVRLIHPASQEYLRAGSMALSEERYGAALALVDSANLFTPDSPDASFLAGRIFADLSQFARSDSAYQRCLSQFPDYPGAWSNIGNNAFDQNEFERALAAYDKEIQTTPQPIPWRGKARAYTELGKVDSARHALSQALALDETYAPAWFNLALIDEDEGNFEDAHRSAAKAYRLSPGDLDFKYLAASLKVSTERLADAEIILREIVAEQPWHVAAHYKLGQVLSRRGHPDEAQGFLARSEELRASEAAINQLLASARAAPNDPFAYAALGTELRKANRYPDAMRAYRMASFISPEDLDIQTNIANLHLLEQDTLASIAQYTRMIVAAPQYVPARLNLGVLHALQNRPDEAAAQWKQVLTMDPENQSARSFLSRLDRQAQPR